VASNYSRIRKQIVKRRGDAFDDIGAFIAEQLYADRTHFIYELLQNAEDARASKVSFALRKTGLEVRHDGQRFTTSDVIGISDLLMGTKAADDATIGRFGIGFKSVYAFTASPEIHSGREHFFIERYIYPSRPRHAM
jgi:hypothetical protein